ncbi:MAG: hypothetical protein N2489_00955 [Clostridia bacterium]|nr:hypothetical protein [Clostridia bacterium]
MKRNLLFFLISALIIFTGAGCSGGETKQDRTEINSSGEQEKKAVEVNEANKESIVLKNEDGSLAVSGGKSVELPKGYPSDKFPVYENSFIYSAVELQGSYTVSAYSKDEVKKVIAFYEKVLEGAKTNMETKTDESLTSMGTKNGYAYTMDVGKSSEQGYQTIITISLQPAASE